MLSCTTLNVYCNRFNVLCFSIRPTGRNRLQSYNRFFKPPNFFWRFFGLAFGLPDVLSPGHPAAAVACFPKASAKLYLFPVPTKFFRHFLCFITYFFWHHFWVSVLKSWHPDSFISRKIWSKVGLFCSFWMPTPIAMIFIADVMTFFRNFVTVFKHPQSWKKSSPLYFLHAFWAQPGTHHHSETSGFMTSQTTLHT